MERPFDRVLGRLYAEGETVAIVSARYVSSIMADRDRIRTLFAMTVYSVAIGLGGAAFVSDPRSELIAVPIGSGFLLAFHALRARTLDELGYAVTGMWAAILAVSAATGIRNEFLLPGAIDPTTPAGVVGITVVLVGGYLAAVAR